MFLQKVLDSAKHTEKKNSENYVPGILVFVLIATMTELG